METTKEFFKDLGVVALIFVIFFLAMGAIGCGDGTPVYNDQGECIANCGDDVLVVDGANPTDAIRDCGSGSDAHCSDAVDVMETDAIEYRCPTETPSDLQMKNCKPSKAMDAICDSDNSGGLQCWRGFFEGKKCEDDKDCQDAPLDEYPPCVCWDACIIHLLYGDKVWYCTPTIELSSEEFFFSSIQILLSFKRQATTCGVETDTDHGSYFYTFVPDDQEKSNLLFSEGIKQWGIPSHFLDMDPDHITVHRTDGGNVIANCCPDKDCE